MNRQIFLGLVLHNHQPVGNFPWVFEEAYQKAYQPMVEALERHPQVRLGLHYTGPLADWLRDNHSDFLPRVAALVARGQVEVLTGGYYEPILPAIPDADKLGQIRYMTEQVTSDFGYQATGMWLAERVWEPGLPKFLAEAGVEWTVLDDSHFKAVGLQDEDLFGYYVTEDQGYPVRLFGTSQELRYSIPWRDPEEVVDYLRREASDGVKIAVMGDDGEKFGGWPGTDKLCWEKGWIDRFFGLLEQNASWLTTIPLGEYVHRYPAIGRVYLPTASYAEMMEWALPAESSVEFTRLVHEFKEQNRTDVLRYLRGGFWRYFLAKYPEVNTLHKKMLRVHDKVYGALAAEPDGDAGLKDLWRGQCNCPYWHGVFGGIYMTDIRAAMYTCLIRAEGAADRKLHEGPWHDWLLTDFDCDSVEELLVESDGQNLYVDLADGGSIFEWDFRAKEFNLASTLARRPEAYHKLLKEAKATQEVTPTGGFSGPAGEAEQEVVNIHELVRVKESGLAERITYDWYRRSCLIDHFLDPETTLAGFQRAEYGELGDFVNNAYELTVTEIPAGLETRRHGDAGTRRPGDTETRRHGDTETRRPGDAGTRGRGDAGHLPASPRPRVSVSPVPGGLQIDLQRDGHLWSDGQHRALRIRKRLRIVDGALEIGYRLTNRGHTAVHGTFASEWNFNLLGGGGNPAAYYRLPDREERLDATGEDELSSLALGNRFLGIELRLALSQPARVWRFPIETISNSEAGYERVYQGSCILPQWQIDLGPGETWAVGLRWELGQP